MGYRIQECVNPGCDKVYQMPKNSLCGGCQGKINKYDYLVGKIKKLESRKTTIFKLPDGTSFIERTRNIDLKEKEVIEFDEQFTNFLKDISTHTCFGTHGFSVNLNGNHYDGQKDGFVFELPIENFKLTRLQYAISGLCRRSYTNGVKYGRNLLFQLNNGDITPDQLEGKVSDVERS